MFERGYEFFAVSDAYPYADSKSFSYSDTDAYPDTDDYSDSNTYANPSASIERINLQGGDGVC